jgi:hypothetical protein
LNGNNSETIPTEYRAPFTVKNNRKMRLEPKLTRALYFENLKIIFLVLVFFGKNMYM